MCSVVVADHMNIEMFGYCLVDLDQKFLELDRAMLAMDRGNHRPIRDVECCEQTRRSVPHIVVRATLGGTWQYWECWLGSLERLYLAFLINR